MVPWMSSLPCSPSFRAAAATITCSLFGRSLPGDDASVGHFVKAIREVTELTQLSFTLHLSLSLSLPLCLSLSVFRSRRPLVKLSWRGRQPLGKFVVTAATSTCQDCGRRYRAAEARVCFRQSRYVTDRRTDGRTDGHALLMVVMTTG